MMPKKWTESETTYLEESWGTISIPKISKKLKKSTNAIKLKASRMKLGRFLESGEYITFNQVMLAIKATNFEKRDRINWIKDKEFPVKLKKVENRCYRIIYLPDFWKWAERNKSLINFAKVEKGVLGIEPNWVEGQRKADVKHSRYKKTPWTAKEDLFLVELLNKYKYSYSDFSIKMNRTEGAIKKRINTLKLKQRPHRADNHTKWTQQEITTLFGLVAKGYTYDVMAGYLNGRSALAIRSKMERINKEELKCN